MKRQLSLLLALSACTAGPNAEPRHPTPPPTNARHAASTASDRASAQGITLPAAREVLLAALDDDVPNVVLGREQLLVDDQPVATRASVLEGGSPHRLDGLFQRLKSERSAWKAAHAKRDFPGVVAFWLDAGTPQFAVESLVYTAAFAGYPNVTFAVRPPAGDARVARMNVAASVPGPARTEKAPDDFELHVEVIGGHQPILVWMQGGVVIQQFAEGEVIASDQRELPLLAKAIDEQWQRYGGHRSQYDHGFDLAVIHFSNELSFQTVVALLDAVYAPKRDFSLGGKVERVPAFDVTYAR